MRRSARTIPFVSAKVEEIRGLARDTSKQASGVQAQLPGVQDRTPWWASLLTRLLAVVGILGVIFLLWRTGLLWAIRSGLTFLIPASTRSAARLAAKGRPETEVVAALRTDPKFNAAYRAAKKETQ